MDFTFTQDQLDLIEGARDFLTGEVTVERLRKQMKDEAVDALWPQLAELGLLGIMADEENGGLDQPLVVMAGIAEAAGYVALSEPLVEVAGISVPAAQQAGADDAVRAMLGGDAAHIIAHDLRSHLASGETFTGIADINNGYTVAKLEGADGLEALQSIDPLRKLSKMNKGGQDAETAMRGAVLSAAQLIGLSSRMLDMAVAYAGDRKQFGQLIGSFQGVKHQLASVHTQIDFTRPIIWQAAMLGGSAVHAAKIAAADTAMLAGETAIQVFGGMGYTFEVDLHMFMKRSWALIGEWGDRNYHAQQLDAWLKDGNTPLGPGASFAN